MLVPQSRTQTSGILHPTGMDFKSNNPSTQTGFYHSNNSLNIWVFLAHFHLKIRILSQSQLDVFMALIGLSEAPFPVFAPLPGGFWRVFPTSSSPPWNVFHFVEKPLGDPKLHLGCCARVGK